MKGSLSFGSTRLYAPVRTGHVQQADPVEPLGGSEPGCGAFCCSTRLCRTGWWPPTSTTEVQPNLEPAFPPEQRFLDAHSSDLAYPIAGNGRPRFTVCQHNPSAATRRAAPPTHLDGHPPRRDVNNARWGPIVGSCSMNDLIAQSGFGQPFRHRSRGRPNAGKSTNTTVL